MNSRDRYKEASTHALAGFQIIEESLKDYIGHYYDAARKVLDGNYTSNIKGQILIKQLLGSF